MAHASEHRHGADRRGKPRGGRRTGDVQDLSPLVLLVGDDEPVTSMAEAVLAKLRFAVTTSKTVDDAIRVLAGLRPDIVVAGAADANRVKREAAGKLSVVVMTDDMRENPEVLIPAIRETLRAKS